ncbi:MAG: DAK2 domain-containing protein [Acidimicrobiia bacterium]
MPALDRLTAVDFRTVVTRYRDALRAHQEELNRLNVYPVPDGDTGTNMALTLESVCHELGTADSMEDVCTAVSHGSLMGARGNSGVILSQILRGLSDSFRGHDDVGAADLVTGLRRASDAAYQAVMRPVEGTILTVARSAAEAAEVNFTGSLVSALDHASRAARQAVDETPELLPVLKEAGVVDAGGRGFTLLLDAFLEVVDGRPIPEPEVFATPAVVEAHLRGEDVSGLRYEVMYLLHAPDATIPGFKAAWGAIGDSIVVVGGDGLWNCHVHTNDIGAAVEVGIDAGRPTKIRVTDLFEQVEQERGWVSEQACMTHVEVPAAAVEVETAVVAVGVGDGIRRLLSSMGVHAIVAGGQSMNPSTAQILDAVKACPSEAVIVLPNNKNIIPVARQVSELTDRRVEIVPTTSVVEALAALVPYDPDASIDANAARMQEAIDRVHPGEVTQAVRDSVAECGPIKQGDWIALDRSGIQATASSAADAAIALVDNLVNGDSEIVTVLLGSDARSADTARLEEHLAFTHPEVEIELHDGGQPLYPYLIGVE